MFVSGVGLVVSLVDQLHISQCGTKGQRTAHPIEGGTSGKTVQNDAEAMCQGEALQIEMWYVVLSASWH